MDTINKPIVIFDSGVGGLSVFHEIKKALPWLSVVYCSDSEGFPYGTKSEEEVTERASQCLNQLTERYQPALAVIACNTASTIALPKVRQQLPFPIVGVVPAIKIAGKVSENRCIGLLATIGTVQRNYIDELVSQFAQDCHVIKVGTNELVTMAESYLRGKAASEQQLAGILSPFFQHKPIPDSIVLGCTHFPLLKPQLQQISPKGVLWIDSGAAIAQRVASLLKTTETNNQCTYTFTFTGGGASISALTPALKQYGFDIITVM